MENKEKTSSDPIQDPERFQREVDEFFEAYPHVDPDTIPDPVWEKVNRGISLKQAYEEYANKNGQTQATAARVNEENRDNSAGNVTGNTKTAYYTAKQVAAMTDAQVRENYNAILESMASEGFYDA